MKFVGLLFLLFVFAVAACSSDGEDSGGSSSTGEFTEVVLTDSERVALTLVELNQDQLTKFGLVEHPGYTNPEFLSKIYKINDLPQPKSTHLAFYATERTGDAGIITTTFNSEDVDAALTSFYLHFRNPRDGTRILNKGNTIVVVFSDFNSPSAEDIAYKLSDRLDLEFLEINRLPELCFFSISFNCTDYSVTDGRIELTLRNDAGRQMVVKEVVATSKAIDDSECGTGEIDTPLSYGSEGIFILDKNPTGSECSYGDGWMNKNPYLIKIQYTWDQSDIVHIVSGELLASG